MIRWWLMLLILAPQQDQEKVKEAVLGVATRTPTRDEVEKYKLERKVRPSGRIITAVTEDGPAHKAGLMKNDVLLSLNKNVFHSEDTLFDFLKVTPPGTKVTAKVIRKDEVKEFEVTLGETEVEKKGVPWQYSGLEQLDTALARAKKDGKNLLVGISGAET